MNSKALKLMIDRYPERKLLARFSNDELLQMIANYRESELLTIGINHQKSVNEEEEAHHTKVEKLQVSQETVIRVE